MDALIDLFTSFSGLLSLAVIAFVCLMAGFFIRLTLRKMEEERLSACLVECREQPPRRRNQKPGFKRTDFNSSASFERNQAGPTQE